MLDTLIFQESPVVEFGGNTFVKVPVILQYGDVPLVEVTQQVDVSFTTTISIYHPDGTYLAKAKGTQLYDTDESKKAGVILRHLGHVTACEMSGQTLFEIRREGAASLKGIAELYTPDGTFIKSSADGISNFIIDGLNGDCIEIGGCSLVGNTFTNMAVGIHIVPPQRPSQPR